MIKLRTLIWGDYPRFSTWTPYNERDRDVRVRKGEVATADGEEKIR